ncbi:hypothetical protein K469DRAFT_755105 [Zopfia rhizophila CBS 207.26]|uniref:Uncharacterized protein n=1 Tax=Zopfia rhizophila CBS 207.26 TaxID=1314779 RepID=A0A6A6DGD2_9PEZI|nr:hypothetical protein K469DRAFT_755105 [Zopfia rhizophila CBS 207.26]
MSALPPKTAESKVHGVPIVEEKKLDRDLEQDGVFPTAPVASCDSLSIQKGEIEPGDLGDAKLLPAAEPQQTWSKRRVHRWKSPLLMLMFFTIGLAMSIAHCIFYLKLRGTVVGDFSSQEEKIWHNGDDSGRFECILRGRHVDIIIAQYRNVSKSTDRNGDEAVRLSRLTQIRSLLLPPFFTPATLFIWPSTQVVELEHPMPYPAIADRSVGHKFAYSPPTRRGATQFVDDVSRTFTGPRTVLSLVSAATASLGEILPIVLPYNRTMYNISFYGPLVRCQEANQTEAIRIDAFLQKDLTTVLGTANQTDSAYYSFVPTLNSTTGELIAASKPRYQTPSNATTQLWMTFLRPATNASGARIKERHYQICRLYNATYDLSIFRDHGFQNISGSYQITSEVPFPHDEPNSISNMAQHAYVAFMLQDKALARNRTLDVLIEELSFNITVGLTHNELLTYNKTTKVQRRDEVNRYGYKPYGLFIPYTLANLFTFVVILFGIFSYIKDDVMPDKKFQDIVSAVEDLEITRAVRSRKRSVTAVFVGDKIVWRAGPENLQGVSLRKVKVLAGRLRKMQSWRRKKSTSANAKG